MALEYYDIYRVRYVEDFHVADRITSGTQSTRRMASSTKDEMILRQTKLVVLLVQMLLAKGEVRDFYFTFSPMGSFIVPCL